MTALAGRLPHARLMFALVVAIALVAMLGPPPARAAGGPVNVTLNIPADVRPNPCRSGDFVNLSGRLHILIYTRSDGMGGFHLQSINDETASGRSLVTGIKFNGSDRYAHYFYAGAPFPAVDTYQHDLRLTSQGSEDNFLMRLQMHLTVNALGVPTAVVDNWTLECTG
jgi:hypothetical protein